MRVLQIGSDRSKRGVLVPGSPAYQRQEAYARHFDALDIIGYSLRSDGFMASTNGNLSIYPTNAPMKLFYGTYALMIARRLPKPSVVSSQDADLCGLLALWIARMRRAPLHVQIHTDIFSEPYALHSPLNFVRLHIALFVLSRADGIRVVSNRIKESIEARITPVRPINVLPIFTDVQKFRDARIDPALASRFAQYASKILVVARLEAEKNVQLAIRSFAAAAPQESCLIIVGDGGNRRELELLAETLGISDRVFFEGEKPAIEYYPLADLVLVPSRYEGYGLVIVEALAAAVPVLSTDVGVAREAGAIISSENDFAKDLKRWFENGPREGVLRQYPYKNFEEYVNLYCDDIGACIKR